MTPRFRLFVISGLGIMTAIAGLSGLWLNQPAKEQAQPVAQAQSPESSAPQDSRGGCG